MIASFDIFDTALLRRCGGPENVWRIMAHRLWPDDEAMQRAFVIWRRHADTKAGPALKDIYDFAGSESFFPYTAESLAAAEMAEERAQLTVNPPVARLIAKHREAGDNIAFVSDMYLPSSLLREVLMREGVMEEGDALHVSCEEGARKDVKGGLFKKAFGKDISRVTHYGDHPRSDVRMARSVGAKARLVESGFTATERAVMDASRDTRHGWELSLLAGASRVARMKHGDTPDARLAADFVAPAMVAYVAHVIRTAQRRGQRRLYFINRDGWLLHRIAEALPHEGLELRYFYASRKSLLPAYLEGASREDFLRIIDGHTLRGRRPDDILAYLGTSCDDLRRRFGLEVGNSTIRTEADGEKWLDILFNDGPVRSSLFGGLSEQSRLLELYLRQEGFDDGVPAAMVDVGWFGSSRLMLNAILSRMGLPEVFTYYLGARRDILPPSAGVYDTYLERMELAPSVSATSAIEAYFCACPLESTASYQLTSDGTVAAVGNGHTPSERVRQVAEINSSVCADVCRVLMSQGMPASDSLYRWMMLSLQSLFSLEYSDIDITPLASLGSFDQRKIARKLSPVEIIMMCLTGRHDLTGFDKASMALSVPHRMAGALWRLHRRAFALRVKAYMIYRDLR